MDNVERAQILGAFELFANMMKQCQYVTPSGDFTELGADIFKDARSKMEHGEEIRDDIFAVFYCNNEKLANIVVISEQRPYWHWMEPDEINSDTLIKTIAFYENAEKGSGDKSEIDFSSSEWNDFEV